ncbi:MAG: 3-hydroxyacyl-CoA dehydrogenase NAD-binding domain-containing protein [Actinobacteria bacterium]|nr:3-hydroxyacyl-CoA dehydrogenase NAD-binding domain-containing protein [Actinomycetota bacterium]
MRVEQITVIGSGAMGSGIAQVFARAGYRVAMFDAASAQLDRALAAISGSLSREVAKGRLTLEESEEAVGRLSTHVDLADAVIGSDLVLEAIVEDMAVKKQLFSQLIACLPETTILASNTSSLSIGEMGLAFGRPELFVGMHFFNPPPLMKLVEVIRGSETSQETVDAALGVVETIGKVPVLVADFPNFIVNRIARPLYLQAQLLLSDGVAAQDIDRALRLGGGLRMGPLELLDMIGLEPHLASSMTAFREWGDPRFRPAPIVKRMVRAGHVGRKSGRGFYRYADGEQTPFLASPTWPIQTDDLGPIGILGEGAEAEFLRAMLGSSGCRVLDTGDRAAEDSGLGDAAVVIVTGDAGQAELVDLFVTLGRACMPSAVLVATSAFVFPEALGVAAGRADRVIGLHRPLSILGRDFYEVATGLDTSAKTVAVALGLVARLRGDAVVTPHRAGYLVNSVLMPMVNEAAFALLEGLASREDIDLAIRLGLNHPFGPLELADRIGVDFVLRVMSTLHEEYADDRYRPCVLLKQMVRAGHLGRKSGRGFYVYASEDEHAPEVSERT